MIRRAEHGLGIGVAAHRTAPPPRHRLHRVAFDAERVVMDHAEPRHRCGHALRGRLFGPAPRLDRIVVDALAFEQHPAQHVLGDGIALLGGGAVQRQRASIVLRHALALEIQRRQIALADGIAAFRGEAKPALGEFGIARNAESFGKAGADIVGGAGNAGMRERRPDRQGTLIVAAIGRLIGRRHLLGHRGRGLSSRQRVE